MTVLRWETNSCHFNKSLLQCVNETSENAITSRFSMYVLNASSLITVSRNKVPRYHAKNDCLPLNWCMIIVFILRSACISIRVRNVQSQDPQPMTLSGLAVLTMV